MGKIRDQGLSKGIQHTKIIRSIGLRLRYRDFPGQMADEN